MSARSDVDGRSALHAAAGRGDAASVERLIGAGADVEVQDRAGLAPLHFAAMSQAADVIRVLLQAGATIDVRDRHGNTALSKATFESKGRGECIRLLLEAGADPDLANDHESSPRALASLIGNYDVAQHFEGVPDGGYGAAASTTHASDAMGGPDHGPAEAPPSATGSADPPDPASSAGPTEKADDPTDYRAEAKGLWQRYVPSRGQADTVQGELVRAVAKLDDEATHNGNINWGPGHATLAEYVRSTLRDSGLFDPEAIDEINADVDRFLDYERPVDDDTPFDRLTRRIVEWSRAHPDPVANPHNPDLQI